MGVTGRGTRAALAIALVLLGMGAPPAYAISEPSQLAISPDGRNVYVADYARTFALSREPESGRLTLVEAYGRGGGYQMELAPDAAHLYVLTSYEVHTYRRDAATGALSYVGRWMRGQSSFRDIEFRDDRTAYLTDRSGNALLVLARDPSSGQLTLRRELKNGRDVPEGLALPGALGLAGDWLHVEESGGLSSFRLAPDGDPTLDLGGYDESSPAAGQNAFAIGRHLYELDPSSGRLSGAPQEAARPSDGGTGPGSGVVDDGSVAVAGAVAYGVDGPDHRMVQYDRGPSGLSLRRAYYEGRDGKGISYPRSVALSPDGRHLYLAAGPVSNASQFGGVGTYTRDPASGDLTFASVIGGFELEPQHTEAPREPPVLAINGGDTFTNDPDVVLSIDLRGHYAGSFDISNDGGFKGAKHFPRNEVDAYLWRLASSGPERLAKTVYVRVNGINHLEPKTITDEILLDQRPPTVVSARRAKKRLAVRARDTLSGVSHIQVTRNRKKPGKWRRFAKSVAATGGRGRILVRVRDRAENHSKWRVVSP